MRTLSKKKKVIHSFHSIGNGKGICFTCGNIEVSLNTGFHFQSQYARRMTLDKKKVDEV